MNRFLSVQLLKAAALLASSLLLSACATVGGAQSVQGTAQSSISQGNVNVYMKDGVAYVTGWVPDASSAQSVKRALLKRDDVDDVELHLQRDM